MNTLLGLKKNSWVWHVTVLSVVLGMLVAAALKTQQTIRVKSGIPTTRNPGLVGALLEEKDRSKKLHEEITDLRSKLNEYESALGEGGAPAGLLSSELQRAKFLAGLLPAHGEGIVVTLRDSRKRPPPDADLTLVEEYIVHDYDIRSFANELAATGAEAVAVNGQRIIASTAIRCAGGAMLINDIRMTPPYEIVAIGPSEQMESTLKMYGGLVDKFRIIEDLSDMVHIQKKKEVVVPAYSGSTRFKYAKPTEPEGGQKR